MGEVPGEAETMAPGDPHFERLADDLYAQFGRPLEREHLGEYVAIMADGQLLLGASLHETADRALETFGPGSYLFRIGTKTVGRF